MFGNKKNQKKLVGTELVYDVLDRFQELVDDLEDAVEHCTSETDAIEDHIDALNIRKTIISSAQNRASQVAANLRNLMGE